MLWSLNENPAVALSVINVQQLNEYGQIIKAKPILPIEYGIGKNSDNHPYDDSKHDLWTRQKTSQNQHPFFFVRIGKK